MYVPVCTVGNKTFFGKRMLDCYFYSIVFDIFWSNRQVDFILLDHPSVNSEINGMQEPSPHDTSVIHPHCFLFD